MAGVFEVYNRNNGELIVRIKEREEQDGKKKADIFIHPNYFRQLQKIDTAACFRFFMTGDGEPFKTFGADEITDKSPLYHQALKMYCEVQFLSHPETYTTKNPKEVKFKASDWTDVEKD